MNSKLRFSLLAFLLLSMTPHVGADPLDALIAKEQANVDNEAVLVYGGNVGKLAAIFWIEWSGVGNPVSGRYQYLSKDRKTVYRLSGNNPKDGVLNLSEYTPSPGIRDELTATCRLTKRVANDRVIWEGTMRNTDGRGFPIRFSRPR